MASDSLDIWGLSQVWVNVVPLMIMATLTLSLLVLSPWGIDPLYSSITHFLTLWPLLLLAVLTYVTRVKLLNEEKDVPS